VGYSAIWFHSHGRELCKRAVLNLTHMDWHRAGEIARPATGATKLLKRGLPTIRQDLEVPSPSRGGLGWGWVSTAGSSATKTHPHPNLPLEGEGVSEALSNCVDAYALKGKVRGWRHRRLSHPCSAPFSGR